VEREGEGEGDQTYGLKNDAFHELIPPRSLNGDPVNMRTLEVLGTLTTGETVLKGETESGHYVLLMTGKHEPRSLEGFAK